MFWESRGPEEEVGGVKASETKQRVKHSWVWKTKGKVNWPLYKSKVEEKMTCFADEMVRDKNTGWSASERYEVFMGYLREAAEESLSKVYMYSGSKSNHSQHAWRDEVVKEAVNRGLS